MAKSQTAPVKTVQLRKPDAMVFAPFGSFIDAATQAGQRKFFSEHLRARKPTSDPVLHVNHIKPSAFPINVIQLERHPFAAQCFIPLDVARYAVAVMPSDSNGLPIPEQTLAFLMPPTIGVIYHPGVWHLGATVLDRTGHFAVLMWRGGPGADDEFQTIDAVTLIVPAVLHSAKNAGETSERRA